jgi:CBS domain-containing protein
VILRRRIKYTDVLETITVKEAMSTDYVTINEADRLEEKFSLLYLHKVSYLLVINDNNDLTGIISATDFQRGFSKGSSQVSDVMTRDLIVVHPKETLRNAFDRLTTYKIECLPVVDEDKPTKLLGILSYYDIESRYETEVTKMQLKRKLTIEELEDDISDD